MLAGEIHLPTLSVDHMGKRVPYPFPVTLGDGESKLVFVPRQEEMFEVIGAWAKDALGHTYRTRFSGRNPTARLKAWRENREVTKKLGRSGRSAHR